MIQPKTLEAAQSQMEPSWGGVRGIQVSPEDAREIIESRAEPKNIWRPDDAIGFVPKRKSRKKVIGEGIPAPASVVELARALKNDVDIIHEYVYSQIQHYPIYGLHKSIEDTVAGTFGNVFEQSRLMVQLLRQAGYTATYQFGTVVFTQTALSAWFGCDPVNPNAVFTFLQNGGFPFTYSWNGTEYVFEFSHVWVKCVIGGTAYMFDPAYKTFNAATAGINLATATGYNRTTLKANSLSGSTVTANSIANFNLSNFESTMTGYVNNLISYLRTNSPAATLEDVLGGRTLVPLTGPVRQTALPYLKAGSTVTEWTGDIPNTYKATLRVQYPGIDQTFYSSDISHKRLTIFFNGSDQPVLRSGGTIVATGTAQTPGTFGTLTMSTVHPYPWGFADRTAFLAVVGGGYYSLINTWGPIGTGLDAYEANLVRESIRAGNSATSEALLGEQYWRHGIRWGASWTLAIAAISKLTNTQTQHHATLGIAGDNGGPDPSRYYGMNLGSSAFAVLSNTYTASEASAALSQVARLGYFMEGKAGTDIKNEGGGSAGSPFLLKANFQENSSADECQSCSQSQTFGIFSLGPTSCLIISQDDEKREAVGGSGGGGSNVNYQPQDVTDWDTNIEPNLVGYSAAEKTKMRNLVVAGSKLLLPQIFTTTTPGGLQVHGYENRDQFYGVTGILNRLKGPIQDCPGPGTGGRPNTNNKPIRQAGADPVDLTTGAFHDNQVDISVGSGEYPYNLIFERFYSSELRQQNGPLGLGWTHNFDMFIQVDESDFADLGKQTAIHAASTVVALYVMKDILNADANQPVDNTMIVILTGAWLKTLVNGAARTVILPTEKQTFLRLPDGSYVSPLDSRAKLVLNGDGSYTMTSLDGVKYNFDGSTGQITTVVFPYGVTVTYSYTSGKLTSVSNGLGRQLTLSYTGNFLSQISDGNGRTVVYTVDANKNLTQVTDPNSQNTVYGYASPGLLTQIFKPANPLNAYLTNVYDSLNRVKQQTDANGNVSQLYIAGYRAEVVDGGGFSQTYYFDDRANCIKEINGVGNVTLRKFDGRNRLVLATLPELNQVAYEYNALDLVTKETWTAKPGSPLAAIINSYTYDPVWNKVKTFVDGLSQTTTFNYDPVSGRLLNIQQPLVGGLTPQDTWTYNGRGQILTYTDAAGVVVQNTYDTTTEKQLTRTVDPGIAPHFNLLTSYGFNAWGDVNSVTDPLLNVTTMVFDNKRRLTQVTSAAPFNYVTKYTWNANDQVTKVEKQTNDPLYPWQTFLTSYDTADNPVTDTDPLTTNVTTSYYNNRGILSKVVDTLGRQNQFFFDGAARLSTNVDNSGVTMDTRTYSSNGSIATIKDAKNNVSQVTRDGHDRIDKTIYPDATYEQNQSYDANGNVLTYRTRAGNTIVNTYDSLNRIATKTPQGQATVTYSYDLAGRLLSASTPVVAGDPSTGIHTFFFDTAGRQFKESYPDGKQVVLVLDANSRTTKITYPDGYFVSRVYDQLNRLVDIKLNGAATAAAHFDYDALSRRTRLTFENSTRIDYTYTRDDDLSTLSAVFSGSTVTFTYGYNNANELVTQSVDDSTYSWHPSAAATTTYLAANNLNQYPKVGTKVQAYNQNGCLTSDGTWTLGYNTECSLISGTKSGTTLAYSYDPLFRQTQKTKTTTTTVKTRYVYNDWQRLADYNGVTGSLSRRFVYGEEDEPLIQVVGASTKTYLYGDRLGSIFAQAPSTGIVGTKYKYGPFGETASVGAFGFGYTSHRYDTDLLMYFAKARYYSPATGRFVQPDLIGYDDGYNLYTYAQNIPTGFVDMTGLQGETGGDKFARAVLPIVGPIIDEASQAAVEYLKNLALKGLLRGLKGGTGPRNVSGGAKSGGGGSAGGKGSTGGGSSGGGPTGGGNSSSGGGITVSKNGYPKYPQVPGAPYPTGELRKLGKEEYKAANKLKNSTNRKIRDMVRSDELKGKEIHEIHPVSLGGSPTDPANKVIVTRHDHRTKLNPYWMKVTEMMKGE